jgi:hypothetical protein
VEDNKAVDDISYSVSPLVSQGGIALLESEKAVAFADNLEAQFYPVTDLSFPAVIETVSMGLRSYFMTPT